MPVVTRTQSSARSTAPLEHPLLNPVILSAIFKQCDIAELEQARRVCKPWRRNSLPAWRARKEYVMIEKRDEGEEGSVESVITEVKSILQLVDTPEGESRFRLQSIPPRNFSFDGWDFSRGNELSLNFWRCCGAWIKILALKACTFGEVGILEEILVQATPNLEQLTLDCNRYAWQGPPSDEDEDGPAPMAQGHLTYLNLHQQESIYGRILPLRSWSRLFCHFPKLESLITRNADCELTDFESELNEMLSGFMKANGDKKKVLLKELDIFLLDPFALDTFPLSSVTLFQELNLPLEILKVDIGYNTTPSVAQQLIEVHSQSLKSLLCYKAPYASPGIARKFPVVGRDEKFPFGVLLKSLESLDLYGLLVSDLGFLRFTPNLKRLVIYMDEMFEEKTSNLNEEDRNEINYKLWVPLRGFNDSQLTCLKKLSGDFELQRSEDIKNLAQWIPSLRTLEIPLNKTTFPVVCQSWKGSLRELHLGGKSLVDDDTFTGIPRKGYSTLEEPQPNILNLRELEEFSYWPTTKSGILSEQSVVHGLLQLPKLRSVACRFLKPLSRENEKKLREAVADVRISSDGA